MAALGEGLARHSTRTTAYVTFVDWVDSGLTVTTTSTSYAPCCKAVIYMENQKEPYVFELNGKTEPTQKAKNLSGGELNIDIIAKPVNMFYPDRSISGGGIGLDVPKGKTGWVYPFWNYSITVKE